MPILDVPSARRRAEFLAAVARSARLHRGVADPPRTPAAFSVYLRRLRGPAHLGYWVEARAREKGIAELALDTSEHAEALIAMYTRRGYRFIEYARWKSVNYRSVILSKRLVEPLDPTRVVERTRPAGSRRASTDPTARSESVVAASRTRKPRRTRPAGRSGEGTFRPIRQSGRVPGPTDSALPPLRA
jgi:hypothetical protein